MSPVAETAERLVTAEDLVLANLDAARTDLDRVRQTLDPRDDLTPPVISSRCERGRCPCPSSACEHECHLDGAP
jgi:hypothetical protein